MHGQLKELIILYHTKPVLRQREFCNDSVFFCLFAHYSILFYSTLFYSFLFYSILFFFILRPFLLIFDDFFSRSNLWTFLCFSTPFFTFLIFSPNLQWLLFHFILFSCASKASITALLGDTTSTRTDAYSTSSSYTSVSDNTVLHLSTYANTLSLYNHDYINNKTEVD